MVKGSYQDLALAAEEMVEICMEYRDTTEGSFATNIGRTLTLLHGLLWN